MANKKITELTELTSPAGADLFAIVDDTDTTTKKVTVTNLMTLAPVQAADISGLATQVSLGNHEALTSAVHGISAFGATLVDDADASAARTTLGLGTAATSANTDFSPAFFSIVSETTTSRTLSNSDNGKIIVCNNTALVTVTVPTGLTSGFNCKVIQEGTGKVKISEASGVTISLISGYNTTTAQYAVIDVINYASEKYVLDSNNIGLDPFAWNGNAISTSYDGTNDYAIASSSMSFTGEFSISFWLRKGTTQSSGNGAFFGSASTSNPYAYSRFSGTGGDFLIRGGPSLTASSSAIVNSTWHHLMVTRNSSNLISIYKNGSSLTSATWSGTFSFDRFMGGTSGLGYFEALFDEVAVWSSDQSANASNIYNSGSPDNLTAYNPLHWWRMGDSDSPSDGDTTPTAVPDVGSDGSNTLTLTNGPAYSTTVA